METLDEFQRCFITLRENAEVPGRQPELHQGQTSFLIPGYYETIGKSRKVKSLQIIVSQKYFGTPQI